MWKCNNCGAENGDSSANCVSCGERKRGAPAKVPASYTTSDQKLPGPNDRYSPQALSLESWGSTLLGISIFIAIIVFIASGFSYDVGWGDLEMAFHFESLLTGILPAACWIGGGYSFKLITKALAIVVESAYRNLMSIKG